MSETPADNTKIDLLGSYRHLDKKTPQGEVDPQHETLNPGRVQTYLENNGFTVKNFDQRFTVKTAMDMLRLSAASGEAQMYSVLNQAQSYLAKIGLPDLMEKTTLAAFSSRLDGELSKRNEQSMRTELVHAYETYQTVRDLAQRTLTIRERFREKREEEKIPTEKTLTQEIAGVAEGIKKNWDKLSGKEKLFLASSLTVGLVMFIRSKDENVKEIRENVVAALKTAGMGAGVLGSLAIGYKLFTGESPVKSLSEWTKQTAAKDGFWENTFKTDAEKAALLQKSVVYLGDKDFLDMARRYREAKAYNDNKVKLPTIMDKDMSPEEIFTVLDTFFSRYPAEMLEQRYRNYVPRPAWAKVVSTQLAEDGRLSIRGNIVDRTIENVEEYASRGWNWLVGEGIAVGHALYTKVFGKEGTDEEVKKWIEKNRDKGVFQKSDLPEYFERLLPAHAENFKKALNAPAVPGFGVQVHEDSKDIYIIASVPFDISKNEQAIGESSRLGIEKADAYLATRIPEIKDNISRFRELPDNAQVRVQSPEGMLLTCVRCPKKGSPEFDLKLHGLQKVPAYEDRRNLELIFGEKPIKYAALRTPDQERIRLRFGLSSHQQAEIDQICDWFTLKYRTQNKSIKEVFDNLFENDKDKEEALEQKGIKPENQLLKVNLLKKIEGDVLDIEKDAAKDVVNAKEAYMDKVHELQKLKGYKVRLAIGGDPAAQAALNYDPQKANAVEELLESYKQECKQYIKDVNEGKVR